MTGDEGGPGVRLRTDWATFGDWAREQPLHGLPPEFQPGAEVGSTPAASSARVVVPAVAAAALAVTSGAEVAIDLRVWGPAGGIVGCLSVLGDLASSLVRHTAAATSTCLAGGSLAVDAASVEASTPVEVGLFGVQDVIGEAIRWIPAAVPEVSDRDLAGVHVAVAAADDAVSCWQQTWAPAAGTWRRCDPPTFVAGTEPGDRQALARDLRFVLSGCLARAACGG